jgi:hypothetical protein
MLPKVSLNCLIDVGGSKSRITKILAGWTSNPYLQMTWPKKNPNDAQKIHFFKFSEI